MPARELRKIEISSEHPFPERGVSVVGILAVRAFVRCSVLAVEGEDTFDRRILASNLQTALEGSPPGGLPGWSVDVQLPSPLRRLPPHTS